MLISRGLSTLKTGNRLFQNAAPLRNSHTWNYRDTIPKPNNSVVIAAEVVQGVAWWWVLWHLYTQPDHILGEFDYPDPTKWTDEELGIPPTE